MHRLRKARVRARTTRLLVAAATVAAGLTVGPLHDAGASSTQDASSDLPVLWSGTLATTKGKSTGGAVAAYVRPPASTLPTMTDAEAKAATEPGVAPVLLGTARTAQDGRFEIRAVPDTTQIPKSWYGADGALDVMVVATADNGEWTIAMDTVQFLEEPGVGRAWFSEPNRFGAARAQAAAAGSAVRSLRSSDGAQRAAQASAALESAAAGDLAAASADDERPSTLRMTFTASTAKSGDLTAAFVPPGAPYAYCYAQSVVGIGNSMRSIAETQTRTYYDMWSNITNAQGTSWKVGVSRNGSSGWSVTGSKTFSESCGVGMIDHFNSGADPNYRRRVEVQVAHAKVYWRCNVLGEPWPVDVYTVEPQYLTGGHYHAAGPSVGCNAAYQVPIGANGSTNRQQSSKTTSSFMASLWGFSAGQTSTYATDTSFSWTNQSVYVRYLCGETGPFVGTTRVSAGD